MRYHKYFWLHIPTGKTGTNTFSEYWGNEGEGLFELKALQLINNWNLSKDWKYWIKP